MGATTASQGPRANRSKAVRARRQRQAGILLALSPTLVVSAVFVYAFIGYTGVVSVSGWEGYKPDLTRTEPWYQTFLTILGEERFQASLRNMVVFTALFLIVSTIAGLLLALAIHRVALASGLFRNIFLFPYALSFIVTGVIWRWLFNPESGINYLFEVTGLNSVMKGLGLDPLRPGWMTDATVVASLNRFLVDPFPWADAVQVQLGIPIALVAIVIAASWQFVGFAMAFFLAAIGGVPQEVREAARIDGAGWLKTQWYVVLPLIRGAVFGVVIVLLFSSLKIFDLVVAMSGSGPGFGTDVPALYVYDQMFKALRYNKAAAGAVVMLIVVAAFAIPYLWRNIRSTGRPTS